jgi:hypothetical protein
MPVCRELDVRFTANKGYSSSSAMYEAAKRISAARHVEGKEIHIIYLGDHDPSGIDMSRDIIERFQLFTRDRVRLNVHRLALNYDQVAMWNPPENPAKQTDSRFEAYAALYGYSSWELDAVEPATLAGLVRDKIEELIDPDAWQQVENREQAYKDRLDDVVSDFENDGEE